MAKPSPPGRLPPRVDPDVVMMICTAGHVDHGKTQLVKLLTGCQTDRLKVERERGLTIELGFAPCVLGGDLCVGIVDVPGHEKFVKNMVAGVSGIGMALLVVAADDGVMPQTVEHVQILELLGVRHGLVALTKTDLVDADRVEQRTEEIQTFLNGTPLAGSPICPVSSETFEGYLAFYETLVARIQGIAKRPSYGVFRMPIERAFTQEGFGSVATGIPVDGSIAPGDQVELLPGERTGRLRAMQRFLRDAQSGGRGQCLALNIPDLGKPAPERGQVLCAPGYLRPARFLHLALRGVPGLEKPLRHAEMAKFHTGTAEAVGKTYLLESKEVAEGLTTLATIALSTPLAAAPGDRFIIRRASPAATVAGGEILAVTHGERRPKTVGLLKQLHAQLDLIADTAPDSPEGASARLECCLRWNLPMGGSLSDVSHAALLRPDAVKEFLAGLVSSGSVRAVGQNHFIHAERHATLLAKVRARLASAREAKALSVSTSQIKGDTEWPPALWAHVLQELIAAKDIRRRGDVFVLPGVAHELPQADRELMERMLALYTATGFQSPRPAELTEKLSAPEAQVQKVLKHLLHERELIRLDKNVVVAYDHFKRAQDLAVHTIQEKGTIDSAQFRTDLDTSRKYAIAFLDFLDGCHVTIRVGNIRKLTKDFERHLL